ncbi:uncharacterized protein PG986_012470 [Apiospora aurea]|uniref:Secreted protein n=1 Tax=Apiospora aurea TaxID=335848 RepID=A0ABR1Q0P9_9PEZI
MYYSLVLNAVFVAAVAAVPAPNNDKKDKRAVGGSASAEGDVVFVPPTVRYCNGPSCHGTPRGAVMAPGECMPAGHGPSWGHGGSTAWRRAEAALPKEEQRVVVAYPSIGEHQWNCPIVVYKSTDCSGQGTILPGLKGPAHHPNWKRNSDDGADAEAEAEDEDKKCKRNGKCKRSARRELSRSATATTIRRCSV